MHDSSLILSTLGTAIGSAQLLELLKQSRYFNWLLCAESSEQIKRTVGIAVAILCAFGVHYEWNEATRVLAFTIPTTGDLLHHGWDAFVQWSLQEAAYKTAVKGK